MKLRFLGAGLALALVAALPAAALSPVPKPPKPKKGSADAVVAFIDTGINPYHEVFRDDSRRARKHPSTYLSGYPKGAEPLRLSLNEKTWSDAVKKDCETWKSVENGQVYYIPGTKIVGAIAFSVEPEIDCNAPEDSYFRILDNGGHGTMTASRGTGAGFGACRECLTVAIQNPMAVNLIDPAASNEFGIASIQWAAGNSSWIDAQSNSWGPIASAWSPTSATGILTGNGEFVQAVERTSKRHLAFWASGNGAAFRGGVLGHPTLLSPHLTPSAISVGGHDSGQINTWPGFPPHLVSDSCESWAAYHQEIDKSAEDVGGGTSGATPYVAGGAARILLEARKILGDKDTGVGRGVVASGPKGLVKSGPLADGKFTLKEWRDVLFKTASARPKQQKEDGSVCDALSAPYNSTPIRWEQVPDGYPEFVHIGYGAVDAQSHKLATKVVAGKAELPDRTVTDQYFAADDATRKALYENVWSKGV